ncbi:metal ABC transporter permease [Candidatus Micrarchaeota archaeon]|nr:metal ABC transporter permease [Candidatus Micrarchaeota archaeon]
MVLELLQYDFMQKALLAGVFITLICGILGVFLVLKRLSLIGDGISHIAFGGIAAGIFFNLNPFFSAIAASIASAFAIEKLREKTRVYSDASIGIVFSTVLSIGVVLISLANGFNSDLHSFLFGNIISVTDLDLVMAASLGIIVLAVLLFYRRQLMYACFDEKSAQSAGINVSRLNLLLILLTAIAVSISIRIVGVLLVSSFLIIPPASALQIAKSFNKALIYSVLFGLISLITGLIASFYFDIASGGAIILSSAILFFAAATGKKLIK